jgi:hypothetical protein
MQCTFIVSAFLLGAVTFTQAEDATQEAAGMGLGTFTCAQFGNQYQGSPRLWKNTILHGRRVS